MTDARYAPGFAGLTNGDDRIEGGTEENAVPHYAAQATLCVTRTAERRLPLSPSERRAKRCEYQRKYREIKNKDEQYRAKIRESRRKYNQTEKARDAKQAWRQSEAGRESKRRWNHSLAGRESMRRSALNRRRSVALGPPLALMEGLMRVKLYATAFAMVPQSLPGFERDDIIADICLAVLSNNINASDVKKFANEIIKNHLNSYFTKYSIESLDSPRFEGGRRTWHDCVSIGLWDD